MAFRELAASLLVVVGHPEQALADVRRAEARSAQIDRPDGVALTFHVSLNKVEPSEAVFACNLLPKDWLRRELAQEMEAGGP